MIRRIAVTAALAAGLAACSAQSAGAACGDPVRAAAHRNGGRPPLEIGDSTSIFAAPILGRLGIEADAQGCRQFFQGLHLLAARGHAHTLPHVVVLALGANGPIAPGQIATALRILGPFRVLALVTAPRAAASVQAMRHAAHSHPDRVLLVDWVRLSATHPGWFAGDGLHVGTEGAEAFARLIRRTIAPVAFPPVEVLSLPKTRNGGRRCGVVHQDGVALDVVILRGEGRLLCPRARALVRLPPLRPPPAGDPTTGGRPNDGPWRWVLRRDDGGAIVGEAPAL